MRHDTGPNHVQVDVDKTAGQVSLGIDRGGVVAIFPERALAMLASVVLLRRSPRDQLHAAGNLSATSVANQEMDVVGGHGVVENRQTKTLFGLIQPEEPASAIFGELEEELSLVAAMGDVPNVVRQKMTMGTGHGASTLE